MYICACLLTIILSDNQNPPTKEVFDSINRGVTRPDRAQHLWGRKIQFKHFNLYLYRCKHPTMLIITKLTVINFLAVIFSQLKTLGERLTELLFKTNNLRLRWKYTPSMWKIYYLET